MIFVDVYVAVQRFHLHSQSSDSQSQDILFKLKPTNIFSPLVVMKMKIMKISFAFLTVVSCDLAFLFVATVHIIDYIGRVVAAFPLESIKVFFDSVAGTIEDDFGFGPPPPTEEQIIGVFPGIQIGTLGEDEIEDAYSDDGADGIASGVGDVRVKTHASNASGGVGNVGRGSCGGRSPGGGANKPTYHVAAFTSEWWGS